MIKSILTCNVRGPKQFGSPRLLVHYQSTNHTITTRSLSSPHTLAHALNHPLRNSLPIPLPTQFLRSLPHSLNHTSSLRNIFSHPHSFLHSFTQPCPPLTQLHTYVNMRVWKGRAALLGFPVCLHFWMECGALVLLACLAKLFSFHNVYLQHKIEP